MLKVNIRKRLGKFHLNVSFEAEEEMVVLFGPSGEGKTTTLNCIAGIIKPDEGKIEVNDKRIFDSMNRINVPLNKRNIGYVFQEDTLFPHLTVYENIAYGLKQPKKDPQRKAEEIKKMLHLLRLEVLENHYPAQLSGGQKQRVAIARTLINKPQILLMDEPFSALDSPVREKLRQDLLRIRHRFRITIVYVTHDMKEAFILGDKIAVLNRGSLEQMGERKEVFYRPKTRNVARFVGTKNIFNGEVTFLNPEANIMKIKNGKFEVETNCCPLELGDRVTFCIRPEEIMVGGKRKENLFRGRIVEVVPQGPSYRLYLQIASDHDYDFLMDVLRHVYFKLNLGINKEITVSLPRDAIHVIT
jgi:molybdate transport system ATP-binding protein